jgi:hypothetical protein
MRRGLLVGRLGKVLLFLRRHTGQAIFFFHWTLSLMLKVTSITAVI